MKKPPSPAIKPETHSGFKFAGIATMGLSAPIIPGKAF
jgi:hypothetical protein